MSEEWQPSKKEYLQVEQEVINLMLKVDEQGRQIRSLAVLCVGMMAYLAYRLFWG